MRFLPTVACHLRYALVLLLIMVLVVFLSKWSGSARASPTTASSLAGDPALLKPPPVTSAHKAAAGRLAVEARKWHEKADATEDGQTALIYATYGLGYMDAALDLVNRNPQALQQAVGFDIDDLRYDLQEQQNQLVRVESYYRPLSVSSTE